MKKKLMIALGLGATLLMTGCAQRLGEFTVASTKNVNLETTATKPQNHVEGKSCIRYILGVIPVGNFNNRIQEAMDNAIDNGHKEGLEGNLLINTRIYTQDWTAVVYGENCIIVEGDLVKVKK